MPQTVKAPTGVSIWMRCGRARAQPVSAALHDAAPTIFYVYLHPSDLTRIERHCATPRRRDAAGAERPRCGRSPGAEKSSKSSG